MSTPDGGGENLVFDWDLLETAQTQLVAKPEQPVITAADGTNPQAAPFGQVPGGAEAAGRLAQWLGGTRTDLRTVSTEVAALAASTGQAARLARDLDPATQVIAQGGGQAAPLSPAQVADGEQQIAEEIGPSGLSGQAPSN